jgi:hypothetical protein
MAMNNIKPIILCLASIPLLSACSGEPEWVSVYEDCKNQIVSLSSEMDKSYQTDNSDPQAKALMESMGNMATNMGNAACEMIRSTCEDAPDGRACQSIIEQSKNRNP